MNTVSKILVFLSLVLLSACTCTQKTNDNKNQRALTISTSVKAIDEGYEFTIVAKRNNINTDEYFSSSETIRLMILDEKGKPIWNSNQGQMFLSVITPVLPEVVGQEYEYKIMWNGKNNLKEKVSIGNYKALVSLATKPQPYGATMEFEVK